MTPHATTTIIPTKVSPATNQEVDTATSMEDESIAIPKVKMHMNP